MGVLYNSRIVTDGLVLCLDAGDRMSYPGAGTTWTDLTANKNNGTLTNGPTFDSANGGSIVLDGVDDRIDTTSLNSYNFHENPYTVGLWCKVNSYTSYKYFWTKNIDDNSALGILFWINNSSQVVFKTFPVVPITDTGVKLTFGNMSSTLSNTWKYYVITCEDGNKTLASNYNFYLDGQYTSPNSTQNSASVTSNSQGIISIGARSLDNNRNMDGDFAIFQVYNRALSAEEIKQNYKATKGRFGL